MSELAEINKNPLDPVSFVKTWEVFDPKVVSSPHRALVAHKFSLNGWSLFVCLLGLLS
jgi:hypothetical protein